MTEQERDLRKQIADEIARKFGRLAPYAAVEAFVRKGAVEQ